MALFQQGMFQINPRDTPETIARKRALANQIMNGPAVAPRSTADGIGNAFASIMGGIAARNMNSKAAAAERAGQESAASAFNPLLDAFRSRIGLDAGGFPAAPNPGDSTSMATMPAPDMASARVAQAHGDSTSPAGNLTESKQAFISALMPAAMQESQRTGVDPRIIVAQAAQETGWGRSAPGNNYFGIKSHGKSGGQTFATHEYVNGKRVNIRDSFRQFDSPADSVRGYGDFILNNPRYRPFMSAQGMDAQLEALQASGYATDPNYSRSVGAIAREIPLDSPIAANEAMAGGGLSNGLTPDALQQWAFANYAPQPANGAVDAVNALGEAQPVGVAETEADILAQEMAMMGQDPQSFQQPQGLPQPQAFAPQPAPPLPAPQNVQDMPVAGMPQQPVQMAQAGGFPEMAGNDPRAIAAPGIDMQAIANVLTNPFSSQEQRSFAQMLLEQEMQSRDPMRQMQLEKGQLEIEALRNPQPDLTSGQREYQMAVQQGYQGSFMDYKRALAEAQRAQTNITVGGDGAPGLGKLSADYGYVLDPTTRQPVIDPSTGLPQAAPVPGSPAARELEEAQRMSQDRAGQGQRYGRIVGEDIGRVLDAVERNPNLVAGPIGSMLAQLPGTGAHDVASMLGTIRANVGFDRLQAMRASSPTGGALGAVSDSENKMLQATLGALEQSQSPQQFATNLRRLQNIYTEIVHGPAPEGTNDDEWTRQAWGVNGAASRPSSAPQAGQIVDGYRFMGGDPADPNNWERQ